MDSQDPQERTDAQEFPVVPGCLENPDSLGDRENWGNRVTQEMWDQEDYQEFPVLKVARATQAWSACREIREWQVPRVLAGSQGKTEDRDNQGLKE